MYLKRFKNLSVCLILILLAVFEMPIIVAAETHPYGAPTPPVACYSFDNEDAFSDMSGNGNNISPYQTTVPTSIPGVKDMGLYFNTSTLKVNNNSSLNFGTNDFSIAFWIKTNDRYCRILDKRLNVQGYSVEIYSGNLLLQIKDPISGFYNYYNPQTRIIADNQWHFVAITVDRDSVTGIKFYIDNNLEASMNATYRMGDISNSTDLLIGQYYFGSLDEVRLYNRVISQDEMNNLYSDYYKCFDMNFDNAFYETSGNGNSSYSSPNPSLFKPGVKNNGLELSINSDKITIPDNPALNFGTSDFSIAFWVKTSQNTLTSSVLDKKTLDAGYDISFLFGCPVIRINGTRYSTYPLDNRLNDDKWHFIVYSVDRDSNIGLKVYSDGTLVKQFDPTSFSNSQITSAVDLKIGRPQSDAFTAMFFEGMLDEITMHGKALTDSEVMEMYNKNKPSDFSFSN